MGMRYRHIHLYCTLASSTITWMTKWRCLLLGQIPIHKIFQLFVKRGEKDPWSDTSAARSASSWTTRSDFLDHFQLKFWNIVTSPNWRRRVGTSTDGDDHHQPTWGWYGLLGTEPVQSHCHPPIMIWKGHMAVQTAQNPPRATNLTTLMVDCMVKMHL